MEQQQNATKIENPTQEKSKPKPPKLKVFELIQKNFATAGITPSLADQSYPFNMIILSGFLALSSGIYCTFIFILYGAQTSVEYTQSVYTCSMVILFILVLLILILKVDNLFELINGCAELVNTSEYEINIEIKNMFQFVRCLHVSLISMKFQH